MAEQGGVGGGGCGGGGPARLDHPLCGQPDLFRTVTSALSRTAHHLYEKPVWASLGRPRSAGSEPIGKEQAARQEIGVWIPSKPTVQRVCEAVE